MTEPFPRGLYKAAVIDFVADGSGPSTTGGSASTTFNCHLEVQLNNSTWSSFGTLVARLGVWVTGIQQIVDLDFTGAQNGYLRVISNAGDEVDTVPYSIDISAVSAVVVHLP
jgi:hypothetical protein